MSGKRNTIAIAAVVLLIAILAAITFFASRTARATAEGQLRAAAANMVVSLDDCVSKPLSFIGRTICDRYRSPEQMASVDMRQLMEAYGLDELNAIDGKGFISASMLPIVGDNQWLKVNPSKFNRALLKEGLGIYSQYFRPSADEPGVFYKYVGIAFPPPAKGYLQLGFKRTRLQNSIDYALGDFVTNWRVGNEGFYLISKVSNGVILSAGREDCRGKTLSEVGFDLFTAREHENLERRDPISNAFLGFERVNFFKARFNGVPCLCTTGVVNLFHRYVVAIPIFDIYDEVVTNLGLTAVILFVVMLVVVFFMSRLSNLVTQLQGYIAREKLATERDLTMAKTIQESSLPVVFPDKPGYRIFAHMYTAKEVGGDFFDFYHVPSGKLFFLIADVSGKGIPAAMFMMKAKAIIKATAFAVDDFAEAIAEANQRLCVNNDAMMFVTTWFGLYDAKTGEIEYVNAGHNPPLVKRADGTVEWLRQRGGPAIGASEMAKYRVNHLQLNPGDSLFLYTDGVTEAMNPKGELYGEDRLECALKKAGMQFVQEIRADVGKFAAGAEQSDDITILALDLKKETNQ